MATSMNSPSEDDLDGEADSQSVEKDGWLPSPGWPKGWPLARPLVPRKAVETDFAELNDGTLIDIVRDSENSSRTLLAVWKAGDLRYLDQMPQHDCLGSAENGEVTFSVNEDSAPSGRGFSRHESLSSDARFCV